MQVALPELNVAATLILDAENPPSEEQFLAFCEANRDLKVERNPKGDIVILPPAGGESDYQNSEVIFQLKGWSKTAGGRVFGATALFLLPDGSALSPDSAWISSERIALLTAKERKGFLRICPEFVIEAMSPSDQLRTAQQKMRNWIANGVSLGWLIDGDAMRVYIYRESGEVQIITGDYIEGEGPVEGFRMDLASIWEGL